jgi:hypothetical protein
VISPGRRLVGRATGVAVARGTTVRSTRALRSDVTGSSATVRGNLQFDALEVRIAGQSSMVVQPPGAIRRLIGRATGVAAVSALMRNLRMVGTARADGVSAVSANLRREQPITGSSAGSARVIHTVSPRAINGNSDGASVVADTVIDLVKDLGGPIGRAPFIRAVVQGRSTRTNHGDERTFVVPASTQVGDRILIHVGSYYRPLATPVGYEILHSTSDYGGYYEDWNIVYTKIATASDPGSTVVLADPNGIGGYVGLTCIIIGNGGVVGSSGHMPSAWMQLNAGPISGGDGVRLAFYSQMSNNHSPHPVFSVPSGGTRLSYVTGIDGYHATQVVSFDADQPDSVISTSQYGAGSGVALSFVPSLQEPPIPGSSTVTADFPTMEWMLMNNYYIYGYTYYDYGQTVGVAEVTGAMTGKADFLLPLGITSGRSIVQGFMTVEDTTEPVIEPPGPGGPGLVLTAAHTERNTFDI